MKNFMRKWLGIDADDQGTKETFYAMHERITALELDFNSRESCKICGKHRYNSPECLAKIGIKRQAA